MDFAKSVGERVRDFRVDEAIAKVGLQCGPYGCGTARDCCLQLEKMILRNIGAKQTGECVLCDFSRWRSSQWRGVE